MVWYSHIFKNFPQFVVIHTVKGFSVVNKAEVDVFLELSCFFSDPSDVGSLISGSAFAKSSLNIWRFIVHILLKPGLENFELYFASICDECNCVVLIVIVGLLTLLIGCCENSDEKSSGQNPWRRPGLWTLAQNWLIASLSP